LNHKEEIVVRQHSLELLELNPTPQQPSKQQTTRPHVILSSRIVSMKKWFSGGRCRCVKREFSLCTARLPENWSYLRRRAGKHGSELPPSMDQLPAKRRFDFQQTILVQNER
jgi:hypothetical protein